MPALGSSRNARLDHRGRATQAGALFDAFVAFREGLGMEILGPGDTGVYRALADRARAGGLVGLLADRDLSRQGIAGDLLRRRPRMPAGPAALAVDTGAALLPVTLFWCEGRTRG